MDFYAITTQRTLDQISRHCPRALYTYTICVSRVDENGRLFLTRDQIRNDLSESYTKFRNNLRALAQEDLLSWGEINNGISIEMYLDECEE